MNKGVSKEIQAKRHQFDAAISKYPYFSFQLSLSLSFRLPFFHLYGSGLAGFAISIKNTSSGASHFVNPVFTASWKKTGLKSPAKANALLLARVTSFSSREDQGCNTTKV